MTLRLPLVLVLMASSVPASAGAQGAPAALRPAPARLLWERPAPVPLRAGAREPLGGLLGRGDEDYRYSGFFVGAGLGLALTAISFVWCADADNACDSGRVLPVGLVVTGALGLSGAVIGGFLPKSPHPKHHGD